MENNNNVQIENRIFLGARYNTIIGFTCNVDEATKGEVLSVKYEESNQKEMNRIQREGALKVLIQLMEQIDTEAIYAPTQVFMVQDLYKVIANQTYKYWIMSGEYSDGTALDEQELELWDKFADLMDSVGRYFVFKDIYNANFEGKAKYNTEDVEYNKFYYDWLIGELERLAPAPKNPRQSARSRRNRNLRTPNEQVG